MAAGREQILLGAEQNSFKSHVLTFYTYQDNK